MVIEWLTFEMAPANRQAFIEVDTEIWTAALRRYSGFISKEVWLDPTLDKTVTLVIRWSTREAWKAISESDLAEISERFDQAIGFTYQMIESREFQIRRFPAS